MAVDAILLRRSLALAFQRDPNLMSNFYRNLFLCHPGIRWMFQRNLRNVQEKMFEQVLRAVVDHLDDDAWLDENLRALGARHAAYGVTREMYGWFGETLLRTLADALDEDWTDALEAGWAAAYARIVALMYASPSQVGGTEL